jgi:hypothetical protein
MIKLKRLMIADEHIKEMNYHNAELYCQLLNIDGYNDWRMPTIQELKNYVPSKFLDFRWFWTFDGYDNDTGIAFHEHFGDEEVDKNIDDKVYILPVRSL